MKHKYNREKNELIKKLTERKPKSDQDLQHEYNSKKRSSEKKKKKKKWHEEENRRSVTSLETETLEPSDIILNVIMLLITHPTTLRNRTASCFNLLFMTLFTRVFSAI